ncbi:LysR family transcriptional regulator [Sulfitobacter noctilucae]|uniref:LysR family transcriptional regulator n=1 Tax=Sulfitobacter noctilucae TaxID=1342302 RepID=UPI00046906E2|nr:LysR family transcriptional regulator [Sulfitobacter noctilucae]KIN65354.1 LysR family transcriptional regulator [Sulfitobacter noctilucae]
MNWRSLPPLSALRAFAAFAQTRNIVAAGEALGVSHAAVSQQLRALEQQMEVALLDRTGRAMALTVAGERLAQALQSSFAQMIEAVEEITGQHEGRPLHISVTPSFAASWLMPRLPTFRAAHPDIDLMIDPSPAVVSLDTGGIDVAIRYGTGPWPGVDAEMLVSSPLVVVAAPALVGDAPFDDLNQLSEFPWLEEFGTTEATRWLRRFGVPQSKPGMMQLPGNFMLDGARDGHGVVVTVREFVARDIAAGRLRELYREEMPDTGYQIVTRKGPARKWVKAFVTWLRREARRPEVIPDQS